MVLGDILVPNAPKKLPENETLRFQAALGCNSAIICR